MRNSFNSVLHFLKHERAYVFLVVFIALFFTVIASKSQWSEAHDPQGIQEMKQMDEVMEENIRNPQFLKEQFEKDPVLSAAVQIFMGIAFLALGAGIVSNLWMMNRVRTKSSWLEAHHGIIDGEWGIEAVVKVIILFLFYSIFANLLLVQIRRFLPEALQTNFLVILHTTLTDLLVLVLVFHFVSRSVSSPLRTLQAKTFSGFFHEMWTGIRSYIATLPSFFTLMMILLAISALFSYEPPPHPLIYIFLEEEKRAPWLVGYSLAVACILGPFVEEIFFRGFVYGALRKQWGIGWATVLTSCFFAYIHDNWFAFLPIFLLSCVLCYLYEKRKSLIASITLHIIHNSAFIFYFFLLKRLLIPEES